LKSYNDFTVNNIFYYDKNSNPIYTKDNGQKYIITSFKLKQDI